MQAPSLAHGFASPISPWWTQAAHPQLWTGCIGAWCPGLGPTGLTLRDWSGEGRSKTLTSMDPGTDWVVGKYGHELEFDGTEQYTSVSVPAGFVSECTVSMHVTFNPSGQDANARVWNIYQSSGVRSSVFLATDRTLSLFSFGMGNNTNIKSQLTGVDDYHIVGVFGTAGAELWINGKLAASDTTNDKSLTFSSGTTVYISKYGGAANFNLAGKLQDFSIYNRALSPNEIGLLAQRPGIAYELEPIEWAPAAAAPPAGFGIPIAAYHYNHNVGSNL